MFSAASLSTSNRELRQRTDRLFAIVPMAAAEGKEAPSPGEAGPELETRSEAAWRLAASGAL